jgi:quinol monooxygenase YgiN
MIEVDMPDLLTVVAEMKAKPGKEEALRAAVLALIEPTRKEEGCVQYDLHVHTSDPGRFVFYENWTSQETLARHAASPHLTEFGRISAELLAEPARVQTYTRIA